MLMQLVSASTVISAIASRTVQKLTTGVRLSGGSGWDDLITGAVFAAPEEMNDLTG
jgi:hypothetical protein